MNKPTYYILRGMLSLMAAVILLTGCQEKQQYTVMPKFVDNLNPQFVALQHGKGDKGKAPDLVIDHLNKLIYNPVPYSLGTKLDSAYLRMHLSSQLEVTLTNELTGRATRWTPSDTGKVDISGGKLRLDISSGKDTSLSYKIRLQIYGYDPNKLTWKRSETALPEPSAAGKVIHFGEHDYWFTQSKSEGATSLYRIIDIREGKFEKMAVHLPNNLVLPTLTLDNRGAIWVLNNEGAAFVSLDLQAWRPVTHEGVHFTALLYDITPIGAAETTLAALGQNSADNRYYTYTLSTEKAELRHPVEAGMPVRNTYVHTYLRAGVIVANLIGGSDAAGAITTAGYFTSDGVKWGRIPYTNKSFIAPKSGALYLNNEGVLHLIGGMMPDGKPIAKMYRSTNRGVSWVELSKSEEPGSDFAPRYGLSGLLRREGGEETYYLFGGVVNGVPSTELWRGYLDKSGGIINAYDKN